MRNPCRIVAFALCIVLCVSSFVMPVSATTSTKNYNSFIDTIFNEIDNGSTSFTILYSGGILNEAFINSAVKKAISSSIKTLFHVYGYSYKYTSSTVTFNFTYSKPQNFNYLYVPDYDELHTVLCRAIAQRKSGLHVYVEDPYYQNDISYMEKLMKGLYDNAVTACYNDYNAYLISEMKLSIASTGAISNNPRGYRITFEFLYNETLSESESVSQFAKKAVTSCTTANMRDADRILAINNYIRRFAYYRETGTRQDYAPIWFVKNKWGVCQGYAMLTSKMLTAAGIQNRIITGEATDPFTGITGPHMWNAVNLSGEWLYLDTTWNDAYPDGINPYFLLTEEEISKTHAFDKKRFSPNIYETAYQNQMRHLDNLIVMQVGSSTMTVGDVTMPIDPLSAITKTVIINNRTYVPIRALVESAGANVGWDSGARQVTINYGNYMLDMWIDNRTIIVNGLEQRLEVAPRIINNRTMVPLRFVAELLGMDVAWDSATSTVTVTPY
jgi:hypothetical protein